MTRITIDILDDLSVVAQMAHAGEVAMVLDRSTWAMRKLAELTLLSHSAVSANVFQFDDLRKSSESVVKALQAWGQGASRLRPPARGEGFAPYEEPAEYDEDEDE